tara:strand:- start:2952 stop:3221 length:270 start_codon:yes stop_codon:yes gene_type:complete
MIILLEEEIDDFEKFSAWFNTEAVPKIEATGGSVLVQGVELENDKMLHLVMETPDQETVAAFMTDEQFTADRIAAGVHVETTKVTFLSN